MSSEIYRKLQQHLDRMPVGFPATESGVEIRILQRLFTPAEAEVALELSVIPEIASVVHKRFGSRMALPELERVLDEMAAKGLIHRIPSRAGALYGKLMFVVGIYERQLNRLTPELERDVRQYSEEAFGAAFHSGKTTQMRIVPVNRTIPLDRGVANYEDIRAYVRTAPGPFAKMPCICRKGKHLLGEECKQTQVRDNCLTIGVAAVFMADAAGAAIVERQEMPDLLDEADKEGLVLQSENTQQPLFVCCCCHCCCGVLTSAQRLPRPADYFSSSFCAVVEGDECQACGTCVVRCQMDAICMDTGKPEVDEARCIGCGLCITTCPSGALRLETKSSSKVPPNDTKALYVRMLQDRYGPWGMARLGVRKALGMKF